MKNCLLLLATSFSLVAPSLVLADLRELESKDLTELASRAAKALAGCPSVAKGSVIALAEVSNRTDEHLDKSQLVAALQKKLIDVKLLGTGESAPTPLALSLVIECQKSEKKSQYTGTYTLKLTLAKASQSSCEKTIRLTKKGVLTK